MAGKKPRRGDEVRVRTTSKLAGGVQPIGGAPWKPHERTGWANRGSGISRHAITESSGRRAGYSNIYIYYCGVCSFVRSLRCTRLTPSSLGEASDAGVLQPLVATFALTHDRLNSALRAAPSKRPGYRLGYRQLRSGPLLALPTSPLRFR